VVSSDHQARKLPNFSSLLGSIEAVFGSPLSFLTNLL